MPPPFVVARIVWVKWSGSCAAIRAWTPQKISATIASNLSRDSITDVKTCFILRACLKIRRGPAWLFVGPCRLEALFAQNICDVTGVFRYLNSAPKDLGGRPALTLIRGNSPRLRALGLKQASILYINDYNCLSRVHSVGCCASCANRNILICYSAM